MAPGTTPETTPEALVAALGLGEALSRDGRMLTIAGYASLMDEASARETSPSLRAFRFGWVRGYVRVFTLVSIINVRRGLATGRRLATATARASTGGALRVCLYEIPIDELPRLVERETRLRLGAARYTGDGGGTPSAEAEGELGTALLCSEFSDEEYFAERCGGSAQVYEERVGQYYSGRLYRDDLLPVPAYVMRCLRAQAAAGPAALANFLDVSFLGDGLTSLRSHLITELAADGAADVWPVEELSALLEGD